MATGAVQILPVIENRRLRLEFRRLLVAVGTRDRDVPSSEQEMSLLVLGKGEGGRLIGLKIVTTIAGVEVRCGGKLSCMAVAVAIGTALKLHSK
jgi:hypothetical protein